MADPGFSYKMGGPNVQIRCDARRPICTEIETGVECPPPNPSRGSEGA